MKQFIIVILLLFSCSKRPDGYIIKKSPFTIDGYSIKRLPDGLCEFVYIYKGGIANSFIDSCKFYYVLDTIGKTKRRK